MVNKIIFALSNISKEKWRFVNYEMVSFERGSPFYFQLRMPKCFSKAKEFQLEIKLLLRKAFSGTCLIETDN